MRLFKSLTGQLKCPGRNTVLQASQTTLLYPPPAQLQGDNSCIAVQLGHCRDVMLQTTAEAGEESRGAEMAGVGFGLTKLGGAGVRYHACECRGEMQVWVLGLGVQGWVKGM